MIADTSRSRSIALAAEISAGFWTFGMASGELFVRNVVLSPGGRVLHYESANERRWRLEDGHIQLIADDGRISARLAPVTSHVPGRLRFEGEHILGGASGLHLALQETDLIYPAHFRWTTAMETAIAAVPFFLMTPFEVSGVYRPGELVSVMQPCFVEPYAALPRGAFVSMGAYSYCHGSFAGSSAIVGRYCSIAGGARPFGPSHPMERVSTSLFSYGPAYIDIARRFGVNDYTIEPYDQTSPPVQIEHDVWIGEDVMMKGGVTIGTGSVLAARSVVTHDVPPYSIVTGTPARTIRSRFPTHLIDALLESEWWAYNFCDLPRRFLEPEAFVTELHCRVNEGTIQKWKPEKIDVARTLLRVVPAET